MRSKDQGQRTWSTDRGPIYGLTCSFLVRLRECVLRTKMDELVLHTMVQPTVRWSWLSFGILGISVDHVEELFHDIGSTYGP